VRCRAAIGRTTHGRAITGCGRTSHRQLSLRAHVEQINTVDGRRSRVFDRRRPLSARETTRERSRLLRNRRQEVRFTDGALIVCTRRKSVTCPRVRAFPVREDRTFVYGVVPTKPRKSTTPPHRSVSRRAASGDAVGLVYGLGLTAGVRRAAWGGAAWLPVRRIVLLCYRFIEDLDVTAIGGTPSKA